MSRSPWAFALLFSSLFAASVGWAKAPKHPARAALSVHPSVGVHVGLGGGGGTCASPRRRRRSTTRRRTLRVPSPSIGVTFKPFQARTPKASRKPRTANKHPKTPSKQPKTASKHPKTTAKQPKTASKHHRTTGKQPKTASAQPTTISKPLSQPQATAAARTGRSRPRFRYSSRRGSSNNEEADAPVTRPATLEWPDGGDPSLDIERYPVDAPEPFAQTAR